MPQLVAAALRTARLERSGAVQGLLSPRPRATHLGCNAVARRQLTSFGNDRAANCRSGAHRCFSKAIHSICRPAGAQACCATAQLTPPGIRCYARDPPGVQACRFTGSAYATWRPLFCTRSAWGALLALSGGVLHSVVAALLGDAPGAQCWYNRGSLRSAVTAVHAMRPKRSAGAQRHLTASGSGCAPCDVPEAQCWR